MTEIKFSPTMVNIKHVVIKDRGINVETYHKVSGSGWNRESDNTSHTKTTIMDIIISATLSNCGVYRSLDTISIYYHGNR